MGMIGTAVVLAWAQLGVKIENFEESEGKATVWISVPEMSNGIDAHGNEMSGKLLIKRLKQKIAEMGAPISIIGRVRSGELWTEEAGEKAMEAAQKEIFGSPAVGRWWW